ncbi:MAG: hypothetical protein M1153_02480, partial [Patescibacteria group bacterium]|nr:hypothetical protein [Patescibacteria group bacterium]
TNYAMGAIIGGHNGCSSQYTAINLNGHVDTTCGNYYNILSGTSDDSLYLNSPSGTSIYFRTNNVNDAYLDNTGMKLLVPLTFSDGTTQTTAYQPQTVSATFPATSGPYENNYVAPNQILLGSLSLTTTKTQSLLFNVNCQYTIASGGLGGIYGGFNLLLNNTENASTTWEIANYGNGWPPCSFTKVIPAVPAGTNTINLYFYYNYNSAANVSVGIGPGQFSLTAL